MDTQDGPLCRGRHPRILAVTRDGVIYMHRLMEKGEYGLVATVKPGQEHEVLWPFPMTLNQVPQRPM